MYCPFCGVELPEDAIYCNHCGKKIPNINPDSHTIIEASPNEVPGVQIDRQQQSAVSPYPASGKNEKNIKKVIVIFVVCLIVLFVASIGIYLIITSSTPQENIVGTWKSTTVYYDEGSSQYASVYYTFNPDGSGTQTWYDMNGREYFSRSVTWSGKNNEYMVLQTDTRDKHTFIISENDIAWVAYGINFVRTEDGAVATPVPTSPMVISQQSPTKITPTSKPTVSPTKKPTASPTVSPTVSLTQSPTYVPTSKPTASPTQTSIEYYDGEVQWEYRGYEYVTSYSVPKSVYDYYIGLKRSSDLAKYATESTNRLYVAEIANSISEAGDELGYTNSEKARMVISFVQALPYMTDLESTGYDEYYKYPIETLVDGCGDCEDTSILTAAFLREMGIGVVLLDFPEHVAVGVKGDDSIKGTYWTYNNDKYFYLETTSTGWAVGQIPDKYKDAKARVIPIS